MARNPESTAPAPIKQSKRSVARPPFASQPRNNHIEDIAATVGGDQVPTTPSAEEATLFGGRATIVNLASEIVLRILDWLEEEPYKTIKFDRRAYLSQESFKPPTPPSATRAQDLANFRQTCKRFSEIGAVHQFARLTIRFSLKEFQRLDNIASQPHLAGAVRKLSYIVPYFYVEGRDRIGDALPSLTASLGQINSQVYIAKLNEQKRILETKEDQRTLVKALTAFSRLQHIQILPVLDSHDRTLLAYIRVNHHLAEFVELNWAPACSHSTWTVSEALTQSASPCTRFSSPRLNPQSAIKLAQPGLPTGPGVLGSLVSQLTCIELHFDDGSEDLDMRMRELSPLLRTVFQSARGIEAVHVGFPSHRPVTLRLDDIFYDVYWKNLVCFGIQGWKLDGEEIMALADRHRNTLRGLRLRDVLLKEGSRWKDVLPYLRNTTTKLEWCSLRRIGYATHFDEQWASIGAEIQDDPQSVDGSDSSDTEDLHSDQHSNSDDSALEDIQFPATNTAAGPPHEFNGSSLHATDFDVDSSYSDDHDSDQDSISESTRSDHTDEHAGNEMEFPLRVAPDGHATPDTPSSLLWCNCSEHPLDLENAGEYSDNGDIIPNGTRKVWEKWVIGSCPIHDAS